MIRRPPDVTIKQNEGKDEKINFLSLLSHTGTILHMYTSNAVVIDNTIFTHITVQSVVHKLQVIKLYIPKNSDFTISRRLDVFQLQRIHFNTVNVCSLA